MSNFASGYVKYINHLEQINDAALARPQVMIDEVEDGYREHLRNIARNILSHYGTAKVCMLAGPSSSGKTTTAHLLRDYLEELGLQAQIVSLDDFYLGTAQMPLLPSGERDYETVNALDVEMVRQCIRSVIDQGTCMLPAYDFMTSERRLNARALDVRENGFVIMEGIHALNPIFTKDLPAGSAIKLYVSVKQQIKDANGEVVSPMDLRLIRRIARDVQFRNTSAERTLAMWPNVVAGEDKYNPPLPDVGGLHGQLDPHLRAVRAALLGHPAAAQHPGGQPALPQGARPRRAADALRAGGPRPRAGKTPCCANFSGRRAPNARSKQIVRNYSIFLYKSARLSFAFL